MLRFLLRMTAWLANLFGASKLAATLRVSVADILLVKGEHERALAAYRQVLSTGVQPTLALYAWARVAVLENQAERFDLAREALDEGMAYVKLVEADDLGHVISVMSDVGAIYHGLGAFDEAKLAWEQGRRWAAQADQKMAEALILGNLAVLHATQGRRDVAIGMRLRSVTLLRELDNKPILAPALVNYASDLLGDHKLDAAMKAYEEGLALAREIGDTKVEALALGNLGSLHRRRGDLGQAEESYRASIALRVEAKAGSEAAAVSNLGDLLVLRGDLQEGERLLREAIGLLSEERQPREAGLAHCNLAQVCRLADRGDEAREEIKAGLALLQRADDREHEGVFRRELSELERAGGDLAAARKAADEAHANSRVAGDKRSEHAATLHRELLRLLAGEERDLSVSTTALQGVRSLPTDDQLIDCLARYAWISHLCHQPGETLDEAKAGADRLSLGPRSPLRQLIAEVERSLPGFET